jgi:hypothetical protein
LRQNEALTPNGVFGFITGPIDGDEFIMYAVLETGSKQYRVAAGDTVEIERLDIEAGKPVTFDRILMVNNDGKVTVGAPTVAGCRGAYPRREEIDVQNETPERLS